MRYRDLPDRSRSFVVFVSHAWMRPHTTPSFAHPDTSSRGGEKYRLIAEAGDRIRAHLPPDVRVLLWIDYSCVDQVRVVVVVVVVFCYSVVRVSVCGSLLSPAFP